MMKWNFIKGYVSDRQTTIENILSATLLLLPLTYRTSFLLLVYKYADEDDDEGAE